ncbi:methyltransferase domain-containing protein [Chlorogloeopsis sp. ULAP01]|uniref:methyltransferase domain-containing protein n=1 Tax=Chlorogloeopsis sp. ULAP01 TaxID=3056483 RepID=UPI0025AA8699|nr:methyltransferase domain-containing protein [Chlorogloeopsis sp. ULAP01]MDM9385237.1 methyltransferase domain-containing protein [Chlorogloeopsis sp. ULAP01]
MQHQINQTKLKLSPIVQSMLRCPICNSELVVRSEDSQCINSQCQALFPHKNRIPILINESASIFSIDDFVNERKLYFDLSPKNQFLETLKNLVPSISLNLKAKRNYEQFSKKLHMRCIHPKVLVIGGSILGKGIENIVENSNLEIVETDVSFGSRTTLICDAHNIPFADRSFDGVIIQAVLEHVVDPWCCVEEIYRVLKDDGLVYAETPFMQQVHGGCYDFTRFTFLGHRRLFRKFEEIESGAVAGPGMALAWSYSYLLLSFTTSKFWRKLIGLFVRITAFPLKYLDYLLIDCPGTLDAASAYYFIGKKSQKILSDKELIKLYQGAC